MNKNGTGKHVSKHFTSATFYKTSNLQKNLQQNSCMLLSLSLKFFFICIQYMKQTCLVPKSKRFK